MPTPINIPPSATLERPRVSAEIPPSPARDATLDLTRASITLLVIAHHAVLAYHLYAPKPGAFTGADLVWGAFPVVDAARAPGLDAFTLWNDAFFMAMMFLLAGLFVAPSLARKGAGHFLRDRALRLGLPFVVSAAVLAPLAYWPAYLLRAGATGNPGFVSAWRALGVWPAGPAWFMWVLLAFCGVAAAMHAITPRVLGKLAAFGAWCRESPVRAGVVFSATVALAYFGTTRLVNPFGWSTWGPFAVQTVRGPLYAIYFFFGYALSAGGPGITGDWMTPIGPLARRWIGWQTAAGVAFVGFVTALITWFTLSGKGTPSLLVDVAANLLFAVSGALTTFAMLAFFARWGHRSHPVLASLTRNAFGMYLVHYVIVTWTQYLLLGVALPGLVKAALVTSFAIGASWGVTILLRRIPGVARVI